jgi:hypothetical protein
MIINLIKEKYLDDVLMSLAEAGIDDTIVISGETLGHKLAFDNPLFAGFRKSFGSDKGYAKIIMAIADKSQVDFMLEELKHSGIDFKKQQIGKIILLPVDQLI